MVVGKDSEMEVKEVEAKEMMTEEEAAGRVKGAADTDRDLVQCPTSATKTERRRRKISSILLVGICAHLFVCACVCVSVSLS